MSLTFDFDRYLNVRSACTPAWLAGGRIAFLSDITGTPQVWAVDASGGWPDQLTFFQDKVWTLNAAPDGESLICSRDIGGNERYQLFFVSADGAVVRRLSRDDQAIHHFGGWSHDGRQVAYVSNARNGIHFDAYVQAVDGGEPRLVFQSDGNYHVVAWSPDDNQLILAHEVSSAHQPLYLLDLASGDIRPLTPEDEPVSNPAVRWAADGTLYLLTDRERDFVGLARLDLRSGQATYLVDHHWDVESLAVSPDARSLAYTVNADGYARLYVHDLAVGQSVQVLGLPPGVVGEPVFSPDGTQVAVSVQSPRHNLDVWLVDANSLDCRQVTHSSLAGIPRDSLAEPELIHYPTFDGRSIPAFFYRPPGGESPLPVILYVHGGPTSQARPDFDPRFQFFLSRGYAILAPNVRGSSGYGKACMALDDVRLRMDSVADLKYAVEWLRASGVVDPTRIAIYGRSYGGFMVLAAVTTYPELWAAAVDVVGIANWVTFLENTGPWRRAHREQEYGSLEHDREFLESISPIHRVDRIRAPMLVIHGANDPRVPVAEADQIVSRLRARGHPVEYLRYEDEGHKIAKLGNRIDSFTRMAGFLARYL
ncbi:MAG: prolyl oligopeptidase family serine peptidase [Chloroflexota bacterium]